MSELLDPPPFPQLYFCCEENRRDAIRGSALNGIDYLEVVDHDAANEDDRQRFLRVHFVNDLVADSLGVSNVRISGGERIRPIVILAATIGAGDDADVLTVEVAEPGDFSLYTLALVSGPDDPRAPAGIDPRLASVEFSFKVECPSDFDCAPRHLCPPEPVATPEINYLAKDYASLRKLLLDRMAFLEPEWQERNPADLGITLVELLAYLGDYLSYEQDAIATEAYLGSARKRVSLRRHARLVDYFVHDGASARVWVQLTADDPIDLPAKTQILSRLDRTPVQIPLITAPDVLRQHPVVFETLHDLHIFPKHNELAFYTWGDRECCLPKGATRATLAGALPDLAPDDVLIFEEKRGSLTGDEDDADRTRRCAVRLTTVQADDGAGGALVDPLSGAAITQIEWRSEDALPFSFCLSGFSDELHGATFYDDLSAVRGNIVLADHGETIAQESLGVVVASPILLPPAQGGDRCDPAPPQFARRRFRPALQRRPVSRGLSYGAAPLPAASQSLLVDPHAALPAITLTSTLQADQEEWTAVRDLLGSAGDAPEFVVEIESDGVATLRFGDATNGQEPEVGMAFDATYRVGNGRAGNVGADSLAHVVSDEPITGVRNPLPAAGGVDPETMAEIRRDAPQAFRTQQRAVTEADYAVAAELDSSVQRAAATLRWTGSWHTVFITVDRFDGLPLTPDFTAQLEREIEPRRMAGQDLEVDSPRYVALEIAMFVCVKPDYFRSDIEAALLDIFSSRTLADGRKGVFQPDFFTFGQTVYLSALYAAAQAVAGVASVQITTFQRQGLAETSGLANGFLAMNRLEIARLENDPNFPEHGLFTLELGGGR